jgi:multidrug efflux pump subunit AcrB
VATSLVLVVVFLPIFTLGGSLGRLYAPIALTISAAVFFSTLNALSFTPVAASRLLHAERREPAWLLRWTDPPRRALEALERPYARLLDRVLNRRWLAVILLLTGLTFTAFGLRQLPKGFIPQEDTGQLRGVVILPEGSSLGQTQRVIEQVRAVAAKEPLVASGNFYAGRSFGDSSPNKGQVFLRLTPIQKRLGAEQSSVVVVERLNRALRERIRSAVVQLSEAPNVRGFSAEGGLELDLLDTSGGRLDLAAFEQEARAFIAEAQNTTIGGRPAFERVSTRFNAGAPRLQLVPDRLRLASLNVDLATVVDTLGASFGSDYVNDSFEGDQVRRVIVQLEGNARRDAADVLALEVRNRDGRLIPLAELVRVGMDAGPTTITRTRQVRSIGIRALPARGVSTGQAMALLQEVQRRRTDDSVDLEWAGLTREESRAGGENLRVFALAIVVMALVLAGLYENFIDPFIILATVPLALLGAVIGLAVRGLPLDVYGQMGLLVLASLAAKNGILIVEFANQRLAEGMPLEAAIRDAAVTRLRPILLTVFASMAGCVPLLFPTGAGAASRLSIGTVVFAGQLLATVLSLFVVPAMYRIVKGWELGRRAATAS